MNDDSSATPSRTEAFAEDLSAVADKLRELAEAGRTDELIELVLTLLSQVRSENSQLTSRLHLLLRSAYGRSSEKVDASQLALLFDELSASQTPESAADCIKVPETPPLHPDDTAKKGKKKRKRRGRMPLPPELPRETSKVPVPDEERVCEVCGKDKQCIGHLESEIL